MLIRAARKERSTPLANALDRHAAITAGRAPQFIPASAFCLRLYPEAVPILSAVRIEELSRKARLDSSIDYGGYSAGIVAAVVGDLEKTAQ